MAIMVFHQEIQLNNNYIKWVYGHTIKGYVFVAFKVRSLDEY